MEKVLMKGNEAIAEAAIYAGCRHYFGYPITPQTEIAAYMAKRLPKMGGVYVQAESEVSAINMVYGAAGAGARVLTSSSGPGISLKAEGLSFLAGADISCVIIDIMRVGPGLGGILSSQADYFQVVKGGGHGDYKMVVLAPNSVQEMVDFTINAFDIADTYRMPVVVLGDGNLGQMMEPVSFKSAKVEKLPHKEWATTGTKGLRKKNVINSLFIETYEMEGILLNRFERYKKIEENEVRFETILCEDADLIIVAYGTTSRVVLTAINKLRAEGIKVGMIRPISLWPFPNEVFKEFAKTTKAFLTVEMSMGQMVEDVRLAVNGVRPVYFFGRVGGIVPTPSEVITEAKKILMN